MIEAVRLGRQPAFLVLEHNSVLLIGKLFASVNFAYKLKNGSKADLVFNLRINISSGSRAGRVIIILSAGFLLIRLIFLNCCSGSRSRNSFFYFSGKRSFCRYGSFLWLRILGTDNVSKQRRNKQSKRNKQKLFQIFHFNSSMLYILRGTALFIITYAQEV